MSVKFTAEQEPWSVWKLEDGSTVRVRLVMVRTVPRGDMDDNGVPIYDFQFQQILNYEPSPEIKIAIAAKSSGSLQ